MPHKKIKSPCFQFYPKDFLSDPNVIRMNYTEVGMYWFLVSYAWLEGCCIPADLGALARMLRVSPEVMSEAWKSMSMCFQPHLQDCAKLVHPRLLIEFEKQANWRNKSSIGGLKSASKRWKHNKISSGKGGYKKVTEKAQPNGNIAVCSLLINKPPISPLNSNQCDEIAAAWNATEGVVQVRKLDAKRRKTLGVRLAEQDWPWKEALAKFPLQCFRDSTNGWRPNLEWFIRPNTADLILEGKYDWSKDSKKPGSLLATDEDKKNYPNIEFS